MTLRPDRPTNDRRATAHQLGSACGIGSDVRDACSAWLPQRPLAPGYDRPGNSKTIEFSSVTFERSRERRWTTTHSNPCGVVLAKLAHMSFRADREVVCGNAAIAVCAGDGDHVAPSR
jgi:hypothetical protein